MEAVRFVVATHWHDDHIRGMAKVLARCKSAGFSCSGALTSREFLAVVGGIEAHPHSRVSSGVQELHQVFSALGASREPTWAFADRLVHRSPDAEVLALSPDDRVYTRFLGSMADRLSEPGGTKGRMPALSPNDVSVVLWVRGAGVIALLGADLPQAGWLRILDRGTRPEGAASAFKVPHHGGKSAHVPGVWDKMLTPSPVAVVAPWTKAGRVLPTEADVRRIVDETPRAYATAPAGRVLRRKDRAQVVAREFRKMGVVIRPD